MHRVVWERQRVFFGDVESYWILFSTYLRYLNADSSLKLPAKGS
jgi:hypothetical protein